MRLKKSVIGPAYASGCIWGVGFACMMKGDWADFHRATDYHFNGKQKTDGHPDIHFVENDMEMMDFHGFSWIFHGSVVGETGNMIFMRLCHLHVTKRRWRVQTFWAACAVVSISPFFVIPQNETWRDTLVLQCFALNGKTYSRFTSKNNSIFVAGGRYKSDDLL